MLITFIAAGISAVYHTEKLRLGMAALIQGAVLFPDYIIQRLAAVYMAGGCAVHGDFCCRISDHLGNRLPEHQTEYQKNESAVERINSR